VCERSLITPPEATAIDLTTEVIPQLRLSLGEATAQEGIISAAIAGATLACENFTGRQLIEAVWELWLESFYDPEVYDEGRLLLPKPPVSAVTSIKYLDTDGVEQTLPTSVYGTLFPSGPQAERASIFLKYGQSWPSHRCQPGAIKIRFTAGYGAAFSAVPQRLRQGLLLAIGEAYESRSLQTVGTIVSPNLVSAESCWWPFRVRWS